MKIIPKRLFRKKKTVRDMEKQAMAVKKKGDTKVPDREKRYPSRALRRASIPAIIFIPIIRDFCFTVPPAADSYVETYHKPLSKTGI